MEELKLPEDEAASAPCTAVCESRRGHWRRAAFPAPAERVVLRAVAVPVADGPVADRRPHDDRVPVHSGRLDAVGGLRDRLRIANSDRPERDVLYRCGGCL